MTRAKGWRWYLSIGLGLVLGVACVAADSWAATAKSTITFDNQSGEPALVKLLNKSTDQAVEQVEVPSGAKRTVSTGGGPNSLTAPGSPSIQSSPASESTKPSTAPIAAPSSLSPRTIGAQFTPGAMQLKVHQDGESSMPMLPIHGIVADLMTAAGFTIHAANARVEAGDLGACPTLM